MKITKCDEAGFLPQATLKRIYSQNSFIILTIETINDKTFLDFLLRTGWVEILRIKPKYIPKAKLDIRHDRKCLHDIK